MPSATPYPNYDVLALARRLCEGQGWELTEVRFYTGIPDRTDNAFWHEFWRAKLAVMGRQAVRVYSRSLRYRNQVVKLPDGTMHTFLAGEEKGIDVRLAVDVIHMAHRGAYDVALLLSQDQDLSEVAEEVRVISHEQDRWMKIASAFPFSPTTRNRRGIARDSRRLATCDRRATCRVPAHRVRAARSRRPLFASLAAPSH